MSNERWRTRDRQTVKPDGPDQHDVPPEPPTDETPVLIDAERMAHALAGETIFLPTELTREEMRAFIIAAAKIAR